jgi:hypothetical protein
VHNWQALLTRHLERVVGAAGREMVMRCGEEIDVETSLNERFRCVKGALERLDALSSEGQKYDVISSCAHVFPAEQIDKLRVLYQEARARTGDPLQAVDEVIAFMDRDPGWVEGSRREGRIVYAAKKPRDPEAYAQAQSNAEKRRAYCFCPIIRNHLEGHAALVLLLRRRLVPAAVGRRHRQAGDGRERAVDPQRRRRVRVCHPSV